MSRTVFWREAGRLLAWRGLAIGVVLGAGLAVVTQARYHPPRPAEAAVERIVVSPDTPGVALAGQIVSGTVTCGPDDRTSRSRVLPPPGEFARQAALLISCRHLNKYSAVVPDMVAAAYRHVPIVCLVTTAQEQAEAEMRFGLHGLPDGAARFLSIPQDAMWVRDCGPAFAQRADGSVEVLDAEYGWRRVISDGSGRMEVRRDDEALPTKLAATLGVPVSPLPLTMSGGNLLTNGEGLAVFSSRLLGRNQHRGYDARKVFELLHERMGFQRFLCVPPLKGELTGHVDMFLCFPAPNAAVVARCDPAADPINAPRLDRVARALAGIPTSRGPMKVYRVPMPPPVRDRWRSYTNVAFANGTLLVPTFSDVDSRLQDEALATYAKLLPRWKVVGIRCDSLSHGNGLLHCISMNVPKYVPVTALAPAATGLKATTAGR